jgi:hypothetical protein
MTSSLRKEILGIDQMEKAMQMIDDSTFTTSTKNSLKCLWRKKHNKTIYKKKNPTVVCEVSEDNAKTRETEGLSMETPQDICRRPGDTHHLFIQKDYIHSHIKRLLLQEKAIDDMLFLSINEALKKRNESIC